MINIQVDNLINKMILYFQIYTCTVNLIDNYTLYLDSTSTSLVDALHPANIFTALDTIGKFRTTDKPGICLPTSKTVGRKFPNKFKNPKPSNSSPIIPHLKVTNSIPTKKQTVPLIRSYL